MRSIVWDVDRWGLMELRFGKIVESGPWNERRVVELTLSVRYTSRCRCR
jgi:hypothetical protein